MIWDITAYALAFKNTIVTLTTTLFSYIQQPRRNGSVLKGHELLKPNHDKKNNKLNSLIIIKEIKFEYK